MGSREIIKYHIAQYERPVFELSVEYVTSSSDCVQDSDVGTLRTLSVTSRTCADHLSFFTEVRSLMSTQCYCPAGSDDLSIHLSPVFKITTYRSEDEFLKKKPRTHIFVKFDNRFYEYVSNLSS